MFIRLQIWNIILVIAAILVSYICATIHGQVDDKFVIPSSFVSIYNDSSMIGTSSWAIRIPSSLSALDMHSWADRIANDVGLKNRGQIGGLTGHYLLYHKSFLNHTINNSQNKRLELARLRREISQLLQDHPNVEWFQHETVLRRSKRSLQFLDQYFPNQWHLVCRTLNY